mmetsp:Transcript_2858/g.7770  ORF Transcript_2858/g.7770 Transcript_2858/m.7770 type:complete len:107 (+) Transcript_2858:940-1260(+)
MDTCHRMLPQKRLFRLCLPYLLRFVRSTAENVGRRKILGEAALDQNDGTDNFFVFILLLFPSRFSEMVNAQGYQKNSRRSVVDLTQLSCDANRFDSQMVLNLSQNI